MVSECGTTDYEGRKHMLVSAKEMLDKAKAGHYAVGQYNINNLEWTKSILLTVQEMKAPAILGVSEGAGKYMTGFDTVVAMVKAMDKALGITVPIALHLDHGTYEGCKKCVEAGFTSIMFDGSHYDIDENVAKTKELVKLAHDNGLSIAINEVYAEFFPEPYPARSCVEVARLPKDVLIEIEAIALL